MAGLIAGFLLILIFITTFKITDDSMLPGFRKGDFVFILKHFSVKNGDAVLYRFPAGSDTVLFKRIIALPGDRVEIRSRELFINGGKMPSPVFASSDTRMLNQALTNRDSMAAVTLGPEEFFVLGDNRNMSFDSRDAGPVKKVQIIGKAFARF